MNKSIVLMIVFLVSFCSIGMIAHSLPIESIIMKKKDESNPPQITIWIHGTLFWFRYIIPKFLHIEQGLNPISSSYEKHYYRSIAHKLEKTDPQRFFFENFYLFGWSGSLSYKERIKAAQKLNEELKNIVIDYQKKYNQKPFIRIITHSHGGNVALNLANLNDCIEIDELILLACPVQQKTEPFIRKSYFKSIISLFSKIDLLQILDPQGFYDKNFKELFLESSSTQPLFSQRTFQPHEKVMQAQITINGKSLFHIDFMLEKFLKHLPEILDTIEKQKQENSTTYFQEPIKLQLT